MIKGIGTDLIELNRIRAQMEKGDRLSERILTEEELVVYHTFPNQTRQAEYLGGRFAAKEAFAKAAGSGIGEQFSFKDIQVFNNDHGAPLLYVRNFLAFNVFVSITHTKEYASAFVVIEHK